MTRTFICAGLLLAGMSLTSAAPDNPPREPKEAKKKEMPEPAPGEVDVAKTAERIVEDANAAGKRLGDKDPGSDTQRLQKEIIKNIDALIRKAEEPPPPSNGESSDMQPMSSSSGGMGNLPKNQGSTSDTAPNPSQSRKERRERHRAQANAKQGMQPLPRLEPKAGAGNPNEQVNKMQPKGLPPRLPDIYKDVWGHLPEKMRLEMDLYFREQFMPRYSDLLKQYYSSLAERGGKTAKTP